MPSAFIAYPGTPAALGTQIDAAVLVLSEQYGQHEIQTWRENDICGRFLVDPILNYIRSADFLIADITKLNFNVAFEIGYAIGCRKRFLLVRNSLIAGDSSLFSTLGIFDTLGYESYDSAEDLARLVVAKFDDPAHLPLDNRHASGRPRFFFLEPPAKDSYDIALKSAIKKVKVGFERYDPQEVGRLPARYAIRSICNEDALVARLLPPIRTDSLIHNIRVAFSAGIAQALERDFLLLQDAEDPVPLDYRDLVTWVPDPDSIAQRISEIALTLWDYHQNTAASGLGVAKKTLLAKVDFGSPIAENESRQLENYYLPTAEFQRALKAEYQAVTGRKGSGKTAFFIELRNALRRNPNNIILDLQPEGYQLLKFRETTLTSLAEGSKQHLLTALWEYVLLLEITQRILREDKGRQ